MPSRQIMLIAGEVSGDERAAQLIVALKSQAAGPAGAGAFEFFGAGGPAMKQAGADLAIDMTRHTVLGPWGVAASYFKQKKLFNRLLSLARERRPEAIVLIDYGVFNRLFAKAVREAVRSGPPSGWNPKIVYYVSPQVWASRPGRAQQLARDIDLMLSIIPFEKDWYAEHTPGFRVEWVGHPLVDKHAEHIEKARAHRELSEPPEILLLPGSRRGELSRHLPVLAPAARRIAAELPEARFSMILPSEDLMAFARTFIPENNPIQLQCGGLTEAMTTADLALASSGSVTHELALFRVPTVVIYRVNWLFWELGKRLATVDYLALPNLIAGEELFPECLQNDATPERIAREALALLTDKERRRLMHDKLETVAQALGTPGAARRAAGFIQRLLDPRQ